MSFQETFSISELQRMCAMSEYLEESDIHMNDTTISWDGNIIYFKNKKPKATGNEFLIPIQVKGKVFESLPQEKSIRYSVRTRDLENYLKNGGTIFFVGAIQKETGSVKMYAKLLLPVDLMKIIKDKEEQDHITIDLALIETFKELEQLCVLFCENKPRQAYITKDMPIPDYDSASQFVVSTLRGKYTDPAIAMVKNPITYFYMKKNDRIIPMLITDLTTAVPGKIWIRIDDKIGQSYPVQRIYKKNTTTLLINEAIAFICNEDTQQLTIKVLESSNINFYVTYKNAELIVAFANASECWIETLQINEKEIRLIQSSFRKDFLKYYERVLRIGKLVDELKISKRLLKTSDAMSAEQSLLFLKRALIEKSIVSLPFAKGEESNIYKQIIGEKRLLLEYEKSGDGYIVRNFLEAGKRFAILVETPEGEKHCINRWFALRGDDIQNILFDEKMLINEMEKINEFEQGQLLGLVLDCLHAYDLDKKTRMLSLAEKLFTVLKQKMKDEMLLTINELQIVARRRSLNEDEKKLLIPYKYSQNFFARCCACILLEDYEEFKFHVQQLSAEDKKEFYTWPIINLLPEVFVEKE